MTTRTLVGAALVVIMGAATAAEAQTYKQRPVNLQRFKTTQTQSFVKLQHERFQCEAGQTKHLVVSGSEDNFSTSGSEPAVKSARVQSPLPAPGWDVGVESSFDNSRVNRKVFSHLNLPNNVKRGRFMIGLREIGEQVNTDGMNIGNLSQQGLTDGNRVGFAYSNGWNTLVAAGSQSGTNYAIDFSNANLISGNGTLQDYYQNTGDTILDVYVQDDHSVDYVAATVCAGPDKKGMTWGIRPPQPEAVNGVAHVGCNDAAGNKCEPYVGDTPCGTELPILCLNPLGLQQPQNLTVSKWDRWSGGIIGTTKPMAAPDKLSVANQACVAEFGKGWRVAEHHDAAVGSSGWMFSAYGNVGTLGKRFWTDIRNQPKAICWDRGQ